MSLSAEDLRRTVQERASGRCEYCRLPEDRSQQVFEVDHIVARKHRGRTVLSNLAWACFSCNSHKGPNLSGVYPVTRRIVGLFKPRIDKWSRHFEWNGAVLVGKTPIGRATVLILEINLSYRLELRESLIAENVSFD